MDVALVAAAVVAASAVMSTYTWYVGRRNEGGRIRFPTTWRHHRNVPYSAEVVVAISLAAAGVTLVFGIAHNDRAGLAPVAILLYGCAILFPSELLRYRHNRRVARTNRSTEPPRNGDG